MKRFTQYVLSAVVALVLFFCVHTMAHADECTNQCFDRWANIDAKIICEQVCRNTEVQKEIAEAVKVIAEQLKQQTEVLKQIQK